MNAGESSKKRFSKPLLIDSRNEVDPVRVSIINVRRPDAIEEIMARAVDVDSALEGRIGRLQAAAGAVVDAHAFEVGYIPVRGRENEKVRHVGKHVAVKIHRRDRRDRGNGKGVVLHVSGDWGLAPSGMRRY